MSRVFNCMVQNSVQKTARARGRPRNFDEGEALERAAKVFWAKGYDGANLDNLVAGTGVVRPSLYATFGDKEALFMRCLEHYAQTVGARATQALYAAPNIRAAIRGFLRQAVEGATGEDTPLGCLMACVAPAVDDRKVREFLAQATRQAEESIEQRLRDAIVGGELPHDFPCVPRARLVVGLAMVVALRARSGTSREALFVDVEEGAGLVFCSTCS